MNFLKNILGKAKQSLKSEGEKVFKATHSGFQSKFDPNTKVSDGPPALYLNHSQKMSVRTSIDLHIQKSKFMHISEEIREACEIVTLAF